MAEFEARVKELTKQNTEAKANVKFLTTLEKQFKNLANEGLASIEETLPSLMNGLRTVWVISRNYKGEEKMKDLLTLISDEIANKVEEQIIIKNLFKLDDKSIPYEIQLQKSIDLITQGHKILKLWVQKYRETRQKIEEDNQERWDFPLQAMSRIEHMNIVCVQLMSIGNDLKKFLLFLGPNLKAVTGKSQGIDKLVLDVKNMTLRFE